MQPISFSNVSQDAFNRLRAEVVSSGASMTGATSGNTSGSITGHGYTADYSYSPPNLEITVTHKPWIEPAGMVENRIRAIVAAAMLAPATATAT